MNKVIKDIPYYHHLNLDLYLPEHSNKKTIVYFHGGGIQSGKKDDYYCVDFGHIFNENGYLFVSVDYSLYPNTKFPNYLLEAAQAIKYVFDHIQEYGGDKKEIYVSGQSAGSWIMMMLCLDQHYLKDIGIDPLDIKGWISDAGQMTSHFNVIHIEDHLNPLVQRIDHKAPLYFVDENFRSSPILMIHYEHDMPNRPEQNRLFVSAIKNFNLPIDIESEELPGQHCHGSTVKNEDGTYDYMNSSLRWLKSH